VHQQLNLCWATIIYTLMQKNSEKGIVMAMRKMEIPVSTAAVIPESSDPPKF